MPALSRRSDNSHRATIAAGKDRPFNFQRLDKALGCFLDSQQNLVVPEKLIQGFSGCDKVGSDICDCHSKDSPGCMTERVR